MRPISLVRSIILMSALLVSCASPTPLPTPGPAQTDFPVGMFKMGMGDQYRFFEDGTYEQYYEPTGDEIHQRGTYTISGDQITMMELEGHCSGEEEAIYSWNYDGEKMKFTHIRDFCTIRKADLANYSFIKITGD